MSTQSIYTQNGLTKPLVSFIVTYHNEPLEMLRECINSILALSLAETERQIIVVDDGSDRSPIAELMELSSTIYYLRQDNQGLSQARNRGITLAEGDFIQFVDADDYLLTSPYEQCLDIVRYKDADMVMFFPSDKPTANPSPDWTGPVSGTDYMTHNNIHASAWGYLFRRRCLHELRFPKGFVHEDEEFTPQLMLRAENVYSTEGKAYHYRVRKDSITHKTDKRWRMRRLMDAEQVIYRLKNKADHLPVSERIAMERRIAQLTMDYIYNVIRMTHDATHLDRVLQRLTKHDLFPLPDKHYTKKYQCFRMLVNTAMGRRILMLALRVKG